MRNCDDLRDQLVKFAKMKDLRVIDVFADSVLYQEFLDWDFQDTEHSQLDSESS